jgi:GT2 family glycosyltransferase
MKLTYVIISRNRRQRLLETLGKLIDNTPLEIAQWETIVVDNASEDGSPDAVRERFPRVRQIVRPINEGMPARNHAFAAARGDFLFSLDDDSYPAPGAVQIALDWMKRRPHVAALTGRAVLPAGDWEASAFPAVILGGASVLRRSVIQQIGGFAPEFFRQAEEYDLSFRIWRAGYAVERCESLIFRHDKQATGRSSATTHKMDLRNNLFLVERFLPRELRRAYRHDWMRRYAAIANADGCPAAVAEALHEARLWARAERASGRQTLDARVVEKIFGLERQGELLREWKRRHRIRKVIIADFSKNLYAAWRACTLAGLEITALADERPAFAGMVHRGMPVLPLPQAIGRGADGIVLSNINPAQIEQRFEALQAAFAGPVLRLWNPDIRHMERRAA